VSRGILLLLKFLLLGIERSSFCIQLVPFILELKLFFLIFELPDSVFEALNLRSVIRLLITGDEEHYLKRQNGGESTLIHRRLLWS
jgi:hypothetical protein